MTINKTALNYCFRAGMFHRYRFLLPNTFLSESESDLLGIRKSGLLDEIELKITKQDYLADYEKRHGDIGLNKHKLIEDGRYLCNYFYFLIPETLVDLLDVPDYCGIYLFRKSVIPGFSYSIKEVRKAPRLHAEKLTIEKKIELMGKLHRRYWSTMDRLLSAESALRHRHV